MKKSNNKNKKNLYIIIAILLVIIIGYFLISNLEIIGNAADVVYNKGLAEASPDLKEQPFESLIHIVATPIASQPLGIVQYNSQVNLSTTTTDATIRYTTDYSEPTVNSNIYSAPFTITGTTNIKAKAYKSGWQSSPTAEFNYIINIVGTPTSSLPSGNVAYNSQIILSTITNGATIRYTLDGSVPIESSNTYFTSAPITITGPTTLKVRAFKQNYGPSEIATFNYTINPVAIPTASQSSGDVAYNSQVSLTTPTNGAVIKYTLNGNDPTESSSSYTGAITINTTTILKAKAYKQNYPPSATATFNYAVPVVSIPVSSPNYGNVSYGANVVLETPTTGAFIRYTVDGSEPNEESVIYNNTPFVINSNITIKAKAYKTGHQPSAIVTFNFIINTVATPIASPQSGTVAFNSPVTLSTTTSGAAIKYTLNGTEPTESSNIYSAPFTIVSATNIKAKAFKTGYVSSSTATFNFTVSTVSTPTATPIGGTYTSAKSIVLSSTTPDANIYYTTNGSEPTTSSTQYLGPIALSQNTTLKAKAFKNGWITSGTLTANYMFVDNGTYVINGSQVIYYYSVGIRDWGCSSIQINTSGNGSENTDHIIEECGNYSAAGYCRSQQYLGHNDWYLPSVSELLTVANYGHLVSGYYWTSESVTDYDNHYARVVQVDMMEGNSSYNCGSGYIGCYRTQVKDIVCIRKEPIN